jgi:hypothetical protein
MSKFSSYEKSQVLFENWRKYIINEDLEVVLTNEEAGELFGEEIEDLLNGEVNESVLGEGLGHLAPFITGPLRKSVNKIMTGKLIPEVHEGVDEIVAHYGGSGAAPAKIQQLAKGIMGSKLLLWTLKGLIPKGKAQVNSSLAQRWRLSLERLFYHHKFPENMIDFLKRTLAQIVSKLGVEGGRLLSGVALQAPPERKIQQERELTGPEEKEKEKIVKGMKKNKKDFKKRYGKEAESIMYATATKQAKKKKNA